MPRDDAARVRDIIEARDRIIKATAGLDREAFARNNLVIRAVFYDFAVSVPKPATQLREIAG